MEYVALVLCICLVAAVGVAVGGILDARHKQHVIEDLQKRLADEDTEDRQAELNAKEQVARLETVVATLKEERSRLEAELAAQATPDDVRARLLRLFSPTGGPGTPLTAAAGVPDDKAPKPD